MLQTPLTVARLRRRAIKAHSRNFSAYASNTTSQGHGVNGQAKKHSLDLSHTSYRYKKAVPGKQLQQHARHKLGLAYPQQHRLSQTWTGGHLPPTSALALNLAFRRQIRLYSAARLAGGHPRAPSFAAMPVAQASAELSTVMARGLSLRAQRRVRKGISALAAPPEAEDGVVYRKNYRLAANPLYRLAAGGVSPPQSGTAGGPGGGSGGVRKTKAVAVLKQYAALGSVARGEGTQRSQRHRLQLHAALKTYAAMK